MTEEINITPPESTYTDPSQAIETVEITLDNFLATADVSRVFGEPVQHDDTTILPCAEVLVGMGFGAGYGSGPAPTGEQSEGSPQKETEAGGGGGGGGGRTLSRPVAVVVASPEGVRVEPIVDPTKIALAAITAAGFMLTTLLRMKRGK
jgi:uncharacterized spore protein YtfJ